MRYFDLSRPRVGKKKNTMRSVKMQTNNPSSATTLKHVADYSFVASGQAFCETGREE